ncbi:unnamed protein product [Protopolystoma xenopodis]|uniref:Uncharacterized protein n=1 Tax=Protopolystoma xenopodis TaxID=117903 RepID=A0A3S5C6X5_9PLAT|nr:unnamed protein product [Protopolystoma xenopodis]
MPSSRHKPNEPLRPTFASPWQPSDSTGGSTDWHHSAVAGSRHQRSFSLAGHSSGKEKIHAQLGLEAVETVATGAGGVMTGQSRSGSSHGLAEVASGRYHVASARPDDTGVASTALGGLYLADRRPSLPYAAPWSGQLLSGPASPLADTAWLKCTTAAFSASSCVASCMNTAMTYNSDSSLQAPTPAVGLVPHDSSDVARSSNRLLAHKAMRQKSLSQVPGTAARADRSVIPSANVIAASSSATTTTTGMLTASGSPAALSDQVRRPTACRLGVEATIASRVPAQQSHQAAHERVSQAEPSSARCGPREQGQADTEGKSVPVERWSIDGCTGGSEMSPAKSETASSGRSEALRPSDQTGQGRDAGKRKMVSSAEEYICAWPSENNSAEQARASLAFCVFHHQCMLDR